MILNAIIKLLNGCNTTENLDSFLKTGSIS